MSTIKAKHYSEIMNLLDELPDYIRLFFEYILNFKNYSPSTVRGYAFDYKIFFMWLISNKLSKTMYIKDVSIADLNNLIPEDIQYFIMYLQQNGNKGVKYSDYTIQRKISSIKSLLDFLNYKIERYLGNDHYVLNTNVFRKLEFTIHSHPTTKSNSKNNDNLGVSFLEFVSRDYISKCNHKLQRINYLSNRQRDTVIIKMIMEGFGLSEIVDMDLDDINLELNLFNPTKYGGESEVHISEELKQYIVDYLEVRDINYSPCSNEKAFILAQNTGCTNGKRIHWRSIQEMIKRYGKAFGDPRLTFLKLHKYNSGRDDHI